MTDVAPPIAAQEAPIAKRGSWKKKAAFGTPANIVD